MRNVTVLAQDAMIENISKAMIFHSGEPFATTNYIARVFGKKHTDVMEKIRSFKSYDEMLRVGKIRPLILKYRGQDYEALELDADAFTFTCLSFTGKKAESFKWSFIQAFKISTAEALSTRIKAETNLANENFFALRQETKKGRKSFTDAIQRLCQYAEEQKGSKYSLNCPYYKHFTSLAYKSIGIKISKAYKPSKDSLSPEALERIEVIEKFLADKILAYIDFKMPYRDIYSLCKKDLKRFKDEVQESQN